MIYEVWTLKQETLLKEALLSQGVPVQVYSSIVERLKILDTYYGTNRRQTDDGGYIAIILDVDMPDIQTAYESLLKKWSLSKECREFSDLLCKCKDNVAWRADLYIVGTEYSLVIVYKSEVL